MSDTPAIFEALAAVMADVQAVAKRDRNDHQKFMFRGIDAVMNAVGPALRTQRVIVTPDVRSVTYQDVTTSTGKASTACRVEVAYTFYATDGSSITTSVAGEAWDHGDKACPKAMSVAFRTALLQALCLPTDEPDPDHHVYERAAVDLAPLRKAIAAARARDIEGDYDGMAEWAAESQQNADAAVRKLQRTIDEYDSQAEDAAAQQGQRPDLPDDEGSGTQAGAPAAGTEPGERDASPPPAADADSDTTGGTGEGETSPSPATNPCPTCGPEPRTNPCPDCPEPELPWQRADRLEISGADQMLKIRELAGPLKATVPARRQHMVPGKAHPGLLDAFVEWLDEVEAGLQQPVGVDRG